MSAGVKAYRVYLINHEVGHGLGQGHPVMVQQAKKPGRVPPLVMAATSPMTPRGPGRPCEQRPAHNRRGG